MHHALPAKAQGFSPSPPRQPAPLTSRAEPGFRLHLPVTPQICLGKETWTRFCVSADLAQEQEQQCPQLPAHHPAERARRWALRVPAGRTSRPAALQGPSCPWESTKAPSLLSKSFRLLNRIKQLLLQLFVALVGGEIQAVKAGETAEAVNSAAIPVLLPTAGSPQAAAARSSCGKDARPGTAATSRGNAGGGDGGCPGPHAGTASGCPHALLTGPSRNDLPCMAPRQPRVFANFIDAEFLGPVAAC